MDITLSCARLAPELALARRVTERKTTIPVYAYARLDAVDGDLRIVATDGESALVTVVPATIREPGSVLVPVRTLADIVRAAAAPDLTLTLAKDRVKVTCGAYTATLGTMSVHDFPIVPEFPAEAIAPLVSQAFAQALDRVRRFIQAEGTSTATHGAYVNIGDGRVDVVATDKHRLGLATLEAPMDRTADLLIPRKAVEDLTAILETAADGEVVEIARDDRRGFFRLGQRIYACALIDLPFLNYRALMKNAGGDTCVAMDRDGLLGVLRRVRLVSDEKTLAVDLDITRKTLAASMESAVKGRADEELTVSLDRGGPFGIRFDAAYLSDFLDVMPPGTVTLEIDANNPRGVALLKGDAPFSYVLAPMAK